MGEGEAELTFSLRLCDFTDRYCVKRGVFALFFLIEDVRQTCWSVVPVSKYISQAFSVLEKRESVKL